MAVAMPVDLPVSAQKIAERLVPLHARHQIYPFERAVFIFR